jgi:hypothetical protein
MAFKKANRGWNGSHDANVVDRKGTATAPPGQKRCRRRAAKIVVNTEDIVRSAARANVPQTEELREEDCDNFVSPRRSRHQYGCNGNRSRMTNVLAIKTSSQQPRTQSPIVSFESGSPPSSSSTSSFAFGVRINSRRNREWSKENLNRQIFVGNIPHDAKQSELVASFTFFGTVVDALIFWKPRSANTYAAVASQGLVRSQKISKQIRSLLES